MSRHAKLGDAILRGCAFVVIQTQGQPDGSAGKGLADFEPT